MSPEALKDVSQSCDQSEQHKPMMKVKVVQRIYVINGSIAFNFPVKIMSCSRKKCKQQI